MNKRESIKRRRLLEEIDYLLKGVVNEDFSELTDISEDGGDNPDVQVGDEIRIISMKGEPLYTDRVGVVKYIDDIGQIHGSWGGCALQPENDVYVLN